MGRTPVGVAIIATHDVSQGIAVALLPAVVLWYLGQDQIKAAFEVDGSAG